MVAFISISMHLRILFVSLTLPTGARVDGSLFTWRCYDHSAPPFRIRFLDAGYLESNAAGRIGLGEKLPPQFGHSLFRGPEAQDVQNVHSKVQITASSDSGGRSLSHHSQFGLNSSTLCSCRLLTLASIGNRSGAILMVLMSEANYHKNYGNQAAPLHAFFMIFHESYPTDYPIDLFFLQHLVFLD